MHEIKKCTYSHEILQWYSVLFAGNLNTSYQIYTDEIIKNGENLLPFISVSFLTTHQLSKT
jgi:hypothetical protein